MSNNVFLFLICGAALSAGVFMSLTLLVAYETGVNPWLALAVAIPAGFLVAAPIIYVIFRAERK